MKRKSSAYHVVLHRAHPILKARANLIVVPGNQMLSKHFSIPTLALKNRQMPNTQYRGLRARILLHHLRSLAYQSPVLRCRMWLRALDQNTRDLDSIPASATDSLWDVGQVIYS